MSYTTYAPNDPFPGRCQNYRSDPYGATSRRCLEYEGTEHVCTFDPPTPAPTVAYSFSVAGTPKPWVKPGNDLGAAQ